MQQRSSDFAKGFLFLQVVIGYEWFASGLTKLVHGDFPGGLSADLEERAKQAAPWYRHFLNSVVIPHSSGFGYAIEVVEVLSGVVLIAAAGIYLLRGERIGGRAKLWLAGSTAVAALAGLVLAVNFALANRMGFSPVAPDSFDEGISLDALLVAMQMVLLGVATAQLARLRTSHSPGAEDSTRKESRHPTELVR